MSEHILDFLNEKFICSLIDENVEDVEVIHDLDKLTFREGFVTEKQICSGIICTAWIAFMDLAKEFPPLNG